jgi:hypothetical protein
VDVVVMIEEKYAIDFTEIGYDQLLIDWLLNRLVKTAGFGKGCLDVGRRPLPHNLSTPGFHSYFLAVGGNTPFRRRYIAVSA